MICTRCDKPITGVRFDLFVMPNADTNDGEYTGCSWHLECINGEIGTHDHLESEVARVTKAPTP